MKGRKRKNFFDLETMPEIEHKAPKILRGVHASPVSETERERRILEGLVEEFAEKGGTIGALPEKFPWIKEHEKLKCLKKYFASYKSKQIQPLEWPFKVVKQPKEAVFVEIEERKRAAMQEEQPARATRSGKAGLFVKKEKPVDEKIHLRPHRKFKRN